MPVLAREGAGRRGTAPHAHPSPRGSRTCADAVRSARPGGPGSPARRAASRRRPDRPCRRSGPLHTCIHEGMWSLGRAPANDSPSPISRLVRRATGSSASGLRGARASHSAGAEPHVVPWTDVECPMSSLRATAAPPLASRRLDLVSCLPHDTSTAARPLPVFRPSWPARTHRPAPPVRRVLHREGESSRGHPTRAAPPSGSETSGVFPMRNPLH